MEKVSPQYLCWLMVHYFPPQGHKQTSACVHSPIPHLSYPSVDSDTSSRLTYNTHRHKVECPTRVTNPQHAYEKAVVADPAQAHQGGSGFSCERTQHNTAQV